MRWDIVARGLLRYSLGWGGLTVLTVYGAATALRFEVGVAALGLLLLGGVSLLLTFLGTTGTGAAASAIEPASGVDVDPQEYATAPIGQPNVRIFFWAVGLLVGALVGLATG